MRHLAVSLLVCALGVACSPRHPAQVSWSIEGQEASADGCGMLGDTVAVHVISRDTIDGEATEEEVVTTECATGIADVGIGNFATVYTELLRDEEAVGVGGPLDVKAEGGAASALNPLSGPVLIDTDIEVSVGFLEVGFEVAQESCADRGVDDVEVSLYRTTGGVERVLVWEEPMTVACEDGFLYDQARVGETYQVEALARSGETYYGTRSPGFRIDQEDPVESATINLIVVTPPAEE